MNVKLASLPSTCHVSSQAHAKSRPSTFKITNASIELVCGHEAVWAAVRHARLCAIASIVVDKLETKVVHVGRLQAREVRGDIEKETETETERSGKKNREVERKRKREIDRDRERMR